MARSWERAASRLTNDVRNARPVRRSPRDPDDVLIVDPIGLALLAPVPQRCTDFTAVTTDDRRRVIGRLTGRRTLS